MNPIKTLVGLKSLKYLQKRRINYIDKQKLRESASMIQLNIKREMQITFQYRKILPQIDKIMRSLRTYLAPDAN